MAQGNYRGADCVFGWSFYSQGAAEGKQSSADQFIDFALRFFGDPDPTQGSPWDKGQRLTDLVREQKTLLILDGLEPLQNPLDKRLKDPALASLLRNLAIQNPGLAVLTTRLDVDDLKDYSDTTVKSVPLEHLSPEAGVQLLKNLGVKGTEKELSAAVKEYKGHALALNLLGTYLATVYEGDIRKRDKIPALLHDKDEQGKHARKVMAAYESWFADKPELNILYIIGLFDRPADVGAMDAVKAEPPIEGLTDKLQNLSDADYKFALQHLRDLRLLEPQDPANPDTLDAHPLVREYFGDKLKSSYPDAWTEAHSRLYEYYKDLPEKDFPDTLEEMQPLFAAVQHGCLAGKHQQTLDDVFWQRIRRRAEGYSIHKLGAPGADLSALSAFFEKPWTKPAPSLTDDAKAAFLNWVGFCLRSLGRLTEAAEPMKAGTNLQAQRKDWPNAASGSANLSELHLTLGRIQNAIDYARNSVAFAQKSGVLFEKIKSHSRLANSLLQAGRIFEAENLFFEAEGLWKEYQSQLPYIPSTEGFWFCDLLLSQGQLIQVEKRAALSLKEYSQKDNVLLDMALDKLSLGWVYLLQAIHEKTRDFTKAADFLNDAVDGLRESGNQDELPRGLFARAELYRYQSKFKEAWTDLEEAKEIAERGQMNLWLADYHLEAARLSLAQGKTKAAAEHYNEAETLVRQMDYHRRDPELLLIQAELQIAAGKKTQAKKTLAAAKKSIDKITAHRWDPELQQLQQKLTP